MRRNILVTVSVLSLAGAAGADPQNVPGEVIRIRDPQPARPLSDLRTRLPYSDDAILGDAWAKAWVLLQIDTTGKVSRLSVLVHPGFGLEPIAVREAWKLTFAPARDPGGTPIVSYLLWGVEWPSVGWLLAHNLPATARIPPAANGVPCKGQGPMKLFSAYPTLRDCRPPPQLTNVSAIRWQVRPRQVTLAG